MPEPGQSRHLSTMMIIIRERKKETEKEVLIFGGFRIDLSFFNARLARQDIDETQWPLVTDQVPPHGMRMEPVQHPTFLS